MNESDTTKTERTPAKETDLERNEVELEVENMGIENDGGMKNAAIVDETETAEAATTRDAPGSTSQSCGSKMKDFLTGVYFGFILYFCSVNLLVWNEGLTVKRTKDIDEGRETLIEVDLNNFMNASVPSAYENRLIHAIGDLNTPDIIMDPIFGVSSQYSIFNNTNTTGNNSTAVTQPISVNSGNFLKLSRSVSMYQWYEIKGKNSLGYHERWLSYFVDSSEFRKRDKYINPESFPFEPFTIEADPVYLGNKIILNDDVVSSFNWYEPLNTIDLNNVPDMSMRSRLTKHTANEYFYLYSNATASSAAHPNIGDTLIQFEVVRPDTISIIARLSSDTDRDGDHELGSHTTDRGGQLLLIERGTHTAEEMFVHAENDNAIRAWTLRIVGFLVMVCSMLLILKPLPSIGEVLPFVGDFISTSMETCLLPMIAVIIALPTCLFVISLAWLAYRPAIAVPIMFVSLCLIVSFYRKIHEKKQEQNNSKGCNDTHENAADDPMKPNKCDDDNNDTVDPFPPFNCPRHSNNNIATADGEKNEETINAYSSRDGFTEALERPPPESAIACDYKTESGDL